MLKNHFVILLRSLNKNRLLVLINVLGLGIAIGCCVVAWFLHDSNATFDSVHANSASIYRVNSISNHLDKVREIGLVPVPLGEAVRENVKDIDLLTRYSKADMTIRVGDELFKTNSAYIDADFFKMFTFQFLHGSSKSLTSKDKIVISDRLALRYFNQENVVNKVVTQLLENNTARDFEIVGVYKTPKLNSSFDRDLYVLYENYWLTPEQAADQDWQSQNALFVSVQNPERIASIEQQLSVYKENANKEAEILINEFKLDNFAGMAMRDEIHNRITRGSTRGAAPIVAVIGFAVMGGLVLLIACFNLANTAIALSQKRLKEIGIRKVMGSIRLQLITQYIGETMFICLAGLFLGIVLAESILLPSFNELWPMMKIEADYSSRPDFLLFMISVLFLTGLVAGSYPAFYVSKFNPIAILKGKLKFGGNNFATYFLLGAQLVLSLSALVCAFAFISNARWQRDFDQGFSKNEGIITYVSDKKEFEAYRNALADNKDILSICGSPHHFQSGFQEGIVNHEGLNVETTIMNVGDDYLKTNGMTLLEGRDFDRDSKTDQEESIIITEEFARQYMWDKAIGKQILWQDTIRLYVVGVVKDIYSVWEPLAPMMIRYAPNDPVSYVLVNTKEGKTQEVNSFMEKNWKKVFPNRPYASRYMNSGVMEADMVNNNLLVMFLFLGGVALLLSVTGLFTLVSLNVLKRMKEIGVRKLLGASLFNIARMINAEFVVIVLIASVAGVYVGSFFANLLMRNIWDHYQTPTIITMLIACFVLIGGCIGSVAIKTFNTAKMNPADVLKDE